MRLEDCFQIGYFSKTHGLQGALVLVLDVDDPSEYEELDSFFVEINGKLVPYFVDNLQLQRDKAVVSLEDVNTLEKAHKLVGCALYLPLDNLPKLQDGQFYYHEIIGYQIVDKLQGKLGLVSAVYELPHQDLIAMQYKGKEVLIPVNDEIVGFADHAIKEIAVNLPEGLVEIYLDEKEDEEPDDSTDEEDSN